ncbi:MAG: VWA domain-containing protein [Pseudohongiellaceae bacterium]
MNESLTFAEALANFHFLRPWWLLALLPGFWLVRTVWRRNAHGSAWQQAIDPELLPWLLDKRPGRSQRAPVILLSLVWFTSIIALAGPTWSQVPYPAQERQSALVVVMDQSLAMTVDDVSPDRQTQARRKLLDILDEREEGQTGLVVYAGGAHVVTPLTEDNVTIRALVPSLSPEIMPSQGNNPSHGVELALELLNESRSGTGHILLMTSGVAADQRQRIRDMMDGSPFILSAIGVGTTNGGPIQGPDGDVLRNDSGQTLVSALDREGLQSLSDSLGGGYRDITLDSEDIRQLLNDTTLPGEGEFADALQEFDVWNDLGPWLLLLALPLTAFIFRRGWLLGLALTSTLVLGSMTPTERLQAQELDRLWRNPDQRGQKAYEEEDHARAAELFESPAWRGAAHYRAGNYQAAAEAYAQGDEDDPDTYYNLGNALARSELYEDAIAAYEAALTLDEDHEDARNNKTIVEDLLEQQEQQESEDSDEQDDEESDEQQQEEGDQEQEEDEEPQEQESEDEPPEGDQREEEPQEQQPDEDGSQDQEQQLNLEETEDQESLEQWLRRLDDNPGELLQRKFQFEYRRRQIEARAAGREL